MGGKSIEGEGLHSVEGYFIDHNQWYVMTPMHMIRSHVGAATLKGNIYVVGVMRLIRHSALKKCFPQLTGCGQG